MAKRYPQSWWCFFRDNSTVRNLVTYFIEDRGHTLTELAAVAKCKPHQIKSYLKNEKPHLTQYQLMSICIHLGIEPSVKVDVTSAYASGNP